MEYRPFPDERVDEFRAFMRYAFSPADGPYDPGSETDDGTIADRRGLFDATDEPVAVCAHHEFTLRIRGTDREVAGLSAVASPPEHRRQGNVGRLLRESLSEYNERGLDVSALWPFAYSFYANYGWAIGSSYRRLTAPPERLAFVDDLVATGGEAAGAFHRFDGDDYPAVRPLLTAMADRYDLTMHWTEEWWRERVLRGRKTDPFVYGWERDGDLRALWAYTFDDDPDEADGAVMRVSDVVFADDEAWFQLLRFLRNHDSQVDEVRLQAPPDAPLLDLADDPRAVTCELRTGPMVRIVDVVEALGDDTLEPGAATETAFSLAVDDSFAGWNDGTFRVEVVDGSVEIDPIEAGRGSDAIGSVESVDTTGATDADRQPDARVDIGTLSQLYVGYATVDEAIRSGGLTVDPDRVNQTGLTDDLRALFPPRTTHLSEGF